MTKEICPHAKNCKAYEIWKKEYKRIRDNIINYNGEYNCSAIELLNSQDKRGIPVNKILEHFAELPLKCSHITLLNLLNQR